MTASTSTILAKLVIDYSMFFEFVTEEALNDDLAVEMLELLGARLQELGNGDKACLIVQLERLSAGYTEQKHADFVRALPDMLGLR